MKRKVTTWFPPGTNPVHVGDYECKTCPPCKHYWNGRAWYYSRGNFEPLTTVTWRGLSEKPAARPTKS